MPEGDTVRKLATELDRRLAGRTLAGGTLGGGGDVALAGRTVERVSAHGKHLFVELDGGLVLRSHLGMHGSWHRYAPDERWRRPRRQAGIVLETADDVFVCFSPSEVELLRVGGARAAGLARGLGPDLTVAGFDPRAAPARARDLWPPSALVAEVLLDQRIAAGIGNVYKSELCFLERVDPRRTLGSLDDATIARLYARAHELLRANLGGGPRATRRTASGEGSLWIYGRTRKGCGACGGPVSSGELGARPRVTYWCRRCQGTRAGAS